MKFKTGNVVNYMHDKTRVVVVLSYDDTKYFNGRSICQDNFNDIDLFDEDDFELNSSEKFKIYLGEIEKTLRTNL